MSYTLVPWLIACQASSRYSGLAMAQGDYSKDELEAALIIRLLPDQHGAQLST